MLRGRLINQHGSVLLPFVITLPFLILIATYYVSLSAQSFRLARKDQLHTSAQLAADAGADYAIEQINQNGSWVGTNGEVTLHNDGSVRTTYSETIASNGNNKTLTTTGRAYWPAATTTPSSQITVSIDLRPVTSPGYSIVTGVGGLYLSNNAKIVGGDVFVNGEINMSNSSQIGLTSSPVNVTVADQICPNPPDSTYPRLCNSGENGQPITISGQAHIYGTVKANNQTSGAGMSNPGLQASSGVSAQPLPSYNRDAQKAAVTTTITGASASCNGSTNKTWAANTKITGDVSITNNCKVTVNGNIWITGNVTVSNQAQLIVASSLGTTVPIIMVDGSTGVSIKNNSLLVPNLNLTGFEIITYWSSASCSPDCASVTGTDLYNSRNTSTILFDNSAAGPQTIFYAHWSRVEINNSGAIGALVGQTIQLKNSGTVAFGTAVGSGSTTWVVNGYRRTYPYF